MCRKNGRRNTIKNDYNNEIIKYEIGPTIDMFERWEKRKDGIYRIFAYTIDGPWFEQWTPYKQIPVLLFKPSEVWSIEGESYGHD